MSDHPAGAARQPRFTKARAAAAGFGLGAALALSPLVWAQNPPAANESLPAASAVSPVIPQQSFAPLVKRVQPAVVNISVTEKSGAEMMSDRLPEGFRDSPFGDFMRRFFDEHGQPNLRPFSEGPGEDGMKRIALGSGFIVDPSGYIVTHNNVVGD